MAIRITGTYTDWRWPSAAAGYDSFEWELTPRSDPSPDGYFWSHQFWLVGGEAGYLGLQTMGSEPRGKIAIFSIWNALAADGPAFVSRFAGEGEGYSVRIPFAWEVGSTYELRVTGSGGGRWEAFVDDRLIGRIRVPARWRGLRDFSVMWTERYAGPVASCADIAHSVARFGVPTANGGLIVPVQRVHHLARPRGCPGSSAYDEPGGVVHVLGAG
jgi:uncharacterized protein DUF3472